MGQKVHPIGFRIGVTEDWRSRWFAPKAAFAEFLIEDHKIRQMLEDRLNRQPPYPGVSKIEIERTRNEVKVVLSTAKPGMVIGAKGAEVDKLREQLEELIDRKVSVSIKEIKNPDLDAQLIALDISEQLKRRASFRRAMKAKCDAAMSAGALGVKIICNGRLGGAEMSRMETQKTGSIPLQRLQAQVDYGFAASFTTYGAIGVKVWLYRGLYAEKGEDGSVIDTGPAEGTATAEGAPAAPRGARGRRGRAEKK